MLLLMRVTSVSILMLLTCIVPLRFVRWSRSCLSGLVLSLLVLPFLFLETFLNHQNIFTAAGVDEIQGSLLLVQHLCPFFLFSSFRASAFLALARALAVLPRMDMSVG